MSFESLSKLQGDILKKKYKLFEIVVKNGKYFCLFTSELSPVTKLTESHGEKAAHKEVLVLAGEGCVCPGQRVRTVKRHVERCELVRHSTTLDVFYGVGILWRDT